MVLIKINLHYRRVGNIIFIMKIRMSLQSVHSGSHGMSQILWRFN